MTTSATLSKPEILAKDVENLLDYLPPEIKILSLDCFDTLLWRQTATPEEVFLISQHMTTHQGSGLTAIKRIEAERKARTKKIYETHSNEVTLAEIYKTHDSALSEKAIEKLASEELEAEIQICYALPTVTQLINEAHNRGLKIIIASDTYFSEAQLRKLLRACISENSYQKINHVFCSSDFQKGKQIGLFDIIKKKLSLSHNQIWHLGDNPYSDVLGAQKSKINATLFLKHQNSTLAELFRLESYAALVLDSRIRYQRPLMNPFQGIFSASNLHDSAEKIVGFCSLGPILFSFAKYIQNECRKLKTTGKKPKLLFLLRDGYLPNLICQKVLEDEFPLTSLYISRFSALASSFQNRNDIDDYLYKYAHPNCFKEICKQLLLESAETDTLIQQALSSQNPTQHFIQLIHDNKRINRIIQASTKYRKRLYCYLENQIDLNENDTIVFVDLGYTGTAQKKLAPIFKKEKNIDVFGRYLIACNSNPNQPHHAGMIDSSWCDERLSSSLITYISLFEKLCAIPSGSVIDYSEEGEVILSNKKPQQNEEEKIRLIQQTAVAFACDAIRFEKQSNIRWSQDRLRDVAMAALGRLLFFPTQSEIQHLKSIEYELDMGSTNSLSVFDEEKGLDGLKSRGLFFMERNASTMRTNYPAELRYAGIEMSTMLLLQERLRYDLRRNDFSLRREKITILIINNGNASHHLLEATPTYDGYFALLIPMGSHFQVAIQFGLHYEWVQINTIELIQSSALFQPNESENTESIIEKVVSQGINKESDNLYECQDKTAFLAYAHDSQSANEKITLRVVFRPISKRK